MSPGAFLETISKHGGLNFVLTNCLPRRAATRFMGWFSKIRQPLVRDVSIAIWRFFCHIDLNEARKTQFDSLHDAFVRELKPGARPIDPDSAIVVSPCDAIVGACGWIVGGELLQVKGRRYPLAELLGDGELAESYRDGCFVTLRLTAGMYHHFHAPYECEVAKVTHIWGDAWNVNPPTLARVDRLYCKNERAVVQIESKAARRRITLVAVAAVLVAGIRLRFAELTIDPRSCAKPIALPGARHFSKGQAMGWFEHGSTIVVLGEAGMRVDESVQTGMTIRMGEPLLRID